MNRLAIYVTREEWSDRERWATIVESARKQMREVRQREVVIRLGRNGPELWKGVNHVQR